MKRILLIAMAMIGFGAINAEAQVTVVHKTTVVRHHRPRHYHSYNHHDNGLHRGWYKHHKHGWDRNDVAQQRRVDRYYDRHENRRFRK